MPILGKRIPTCGMELRRTDWAVLLDDEKQGGCLVPIFVLAHENDPDPEMRPYKRAISTDVVLPQG